MQSTNFSEKMLENLNKQIKFVLENEHSSFYSKKYQEANLKKITSFEDFKKIPILIKNEFISLDYNQRTFVPQEDVLYYSFSSGTTNAQRPAIIPHLSYYCEGMEKYQFNKDKFQKIGVTKVLMLLQPLASLNFRVLFMESKPAKFIAGDVKNLKLMAQIIKELSIEGILTTATVLDFLIAEMQSANVDFNQIKWISLGGEACSRLRLSYFQKLFPKAYLYMRFGNSEIGGARHFQCKYLHESNHQSFHIASDAELIEIVDDENNVVPFGTPGEIVHTDLNKKAFPLIRYKTKDIGCLTKNPCPCGQNYTLTVFGKAQHDVVKAYGTTFHSDLIAQALENMQPEIEPRFQLHIFEKEMGSFIKPELELHLKLRNNKSKTNENESMLMEVMAAKISKRLKISSTATLLDAIEQGYFLPLKIKFIKSWPPEETKSKNIILHF